MRTYCHNGVRYEIGLNQPEIDRRLGHLLANLLPAYQPAPVDGAETIGGYSATYQGEPANRSRLHLPAHTGAGLSPLSASGDAATVAARLERREPCSDVLYDGRKEAPH